MRLITSRHIILTLTLALLAGLGTTELFRLTLEANNRVAFDNWAEREATALLERTLGGRAMGAVVFSGETDPSLRAAATGRDPARRTDGDNAARSLETLGREINGEGTFVVNRAGIIVASWDAMGRIRIGTDVGFRPFVQSALDGTETVYAAVGISTGERALFLAAPVWASQNEQKAVVGALVGRVGIDVIERSLRNGSDIALLVSPHGVVFASSRRDWLLSLVGDASHDRIRAIAALRQFGAAFDSPHRIRTLPFDPNSTTVQIDQTRYMAARLPLKWNDPGGDWSLVLLTDLASAAPMALRAGIGALATLGTACFGLLALSRRDAVARQRQEQSIQDAEARQQIAITERQNRQFDLIARLHQTTNLTEMAQELFSGLGRDLPLHQGSLYVSDDDGQRFHLAGFHGNGRAPEQIGTSDGMIGECARQSRTLCFEDPPAGVWRLRPGPGPGEASPRVLLLLPLVHDGRVLGVLELASLSPALAENRATVETILPTLAVQIDFLRATRQARDHLAEVNRLTESVRLQQDLSQQTEDWFRTILDGMPVGLLVVDSSGRIILSNPEIEHLSGYSLDELLGENIEKLLPAPLRAQHVEWRNALTMGEDQVIRMGRKHPALPLVTRDGPEIMVEISLMQTPALGSQRPCVCAMIRPM
ncbi:PAS domain S-box protein [Magnetospirillum molischianum]|nr:PAS domain S-box protein [Magnetospirillum molischianum]